MGPILRGGGKIDLTAGALDFFNDDRVRGVLDVDDAAVEDELVEAAVLNDRRVIRSRRLRINHHLGIPLRAVLKRQTQVLDVLFLFRQRARVVEDDAASPGGLCAREDEIEVDVDDGAAVLLLAGRLDRDVADDDHPFGRLVGIDVDERVPAGVDGVAFPALDPDRPARGVDVDLAVGERHDRQVAGLDVDVPRLQVHGRVRLRTRRGLGVVLRPDAAALRQDVDTVGCLERHRPGQTIVAFDGEQSPVIGVGSRLLNSNGRRVLAADHDIRPARHLDGVARIGIGRIRDRDGIPKIVVVTRRLVFNLARDAAPVDLRRRLRCSHSKKRPDQGRRHCLSEHHTILFFLVVKWSFTPAGSTDRAL